MLWLAGGVIKLNHDFWHISFIELSGEGQFLFESITHSRVYLERRLEEDPELLHEG
jgi:hypothetical protein